MSRHVCSALEAADALPHFPYPDVGCTYLLAGLGPVFRRGTAVARLSPFLGGRVEFVDDLSTGGFGLGGAVTGGLTLRVSDNVGIRSEVAGRLTRFRRIYGYFDTGLDLRDTGIWQWGCLLSLSLGAKLAIR